jgi:hypothetical protein
VNVQTRKEGSQAHRMINAVRPFLKFEQSQFIRFFYNYLLTIRQKIWCNTDADSENMYSVSQVISSLIRYLTNQNQIKEWQKIIREETVKALKNLKALSPEESDVVFSLLSGGEYAPITAGDQAVTDAGDNVTVLGYSENWLQASELQKLLQGSDDLKALKMVPEFSNDKQKAIALFNNSKMKARQELMIIQPSTLLPAYKTQDFSENEANNSPLMDKEIVAALLEVLESSESGYKKHYLNQQKA